METIEVVYVPVIKVSLPGDFEAQIPPTSLVTYHETLLYTNSSGQQFMATAYPENRQGGSSQFSDVAGAASGLSANYGKLKTWTGSTSDTSQFSENEINNGFSPRPIPGKRSPVETISARNGPKSSRRSRK
jgi:hypothetical protein